MHDVVLVLHVVAGAVGLVAGPLAGTARKQEGLHTAAGWTYQVCTAVLCASTSVLVALRPALWPFLLLAVPTWTAAVAAVVVRRRRRPGWLPLHVQLALGSYVSFVTAFSVQTVGGLASWLVPAALGALGVSAVTRRVRSAEARRRRVRTGSVAA